MININVDADTPLFAQLTEQIKLAVAKGKIEPGQPLPSIRQLSADLDLNPKTVAKAYKVLERDSIIETKGYRGTFVHLDAKQNCQFDLLDWLKTKVSNDVKEYRARGATDSEIRAALAAALSNEL